MRSIHCVSFALFMLFCSIACAAQAQDKGSASTQPVNQHAPKRITRDEADSLVWKLPEVKAWDRYLKRTTQGSVKGATSDWGDGPELLKNGKYYWPVRAQEDRPDRVFPWVDFMVRVDGKEILVYDLPNEKYWTLKQWRAKKPMEEMGG